MAAGIRAPYRVGVDIGGTFTDIIIADGDGRLYTKKVSSSTENYALAIISGVEELLAESGIPASMIAEIRHGTTVGSNAILEQRGARTGLIGTKGFRDILEIRTLRMPRLYDLHWEKPPPLVDRDLRLTVDERIDARGCVIKALDLAQAEAAVRRLLAADVEAIAICLINSFTNPVHELAIKQIVERLAPDITVCTSYEVLPEIKEYERTSTTVINAYLKPVVARYLESLRRHLDRFDILAPLLLMQSNGGLMSDGAAAQRPIHIVESGPAGGVIGCHALAEAIGVADVITFDMGGTTAKASLIEKGEVTRVHECEVGGGVISGSRLLTGGGYTIKVPAIDLAEVGAGGGSIIWIDTGGAMRVGPRSAGANPGPVCYGQGGTEPTITDANVVLGYINPGYLVGGGLRLDAQKSLQAIEAKVARPLGLSPERAAYGAHQIATANMIRAIKSVSTERGRDPRKHVMFAFGGNGPLFAAAMAAALGMKRIIVPPAPGLFSSLGLLTAEVEHYYSRSFRRLLRQADLEELSAAWSELENQALNQLKMEGFADQEICLRRAAAVHYHGQTFDLVVPVAPGKLDKAAITHIEEAFGREHEITYGHRAGPDEPVELMTIHVIGQGTSGRKGLPDRMTLSRAEPPRPQPRNAYFGAAGWIETPVFRRSDIGRSRTGPLIIEEYDATCVVPPGAHVELDRFGNICIGLSS